MVQANDKQKRYGLGSSKPSARNSLGGSPDELNQLRSPQAKPAKGGKLLFPTKILSDSTKEEEKELQVDLLDCFMVLASGAMQRF